MHGNKNKIKKFIVFLLVFAELAAAPALALAQLDVPTSNSALGTGGIVGTTENAVADSLLKVVITALDLCVGPFKIALDGQNKANNAFGGLELISGNANVVAIIQSKLVAVDGILTCRLTADSSIRNIPTPNVYIGQKKQRLEEVNNAEIQTYQKIKEDLNKQLNVAKQSFWKTLVWNVLIKTTKSITISLANKLMNNFKINDFSKYADAVATQVYDNQYIRANYSGSGSDQLIVRSMLNNPLAQREIQPAVLRAADAALGFIPNQVDTSASNQNFYAQMATVGSGSANPYLRQTVYANATQQIHSQALAQANAEIAQSNGLKTPRNCAGAIGQQQIIDKNWDAMNNQLANRQALLNDLTNYRNNMTNFTTEQAQQIDKDIAKAQADVSTAQTALDSVPDSAGGSPAIKICEAIVSPPMMINKGIDTAFKAIGDKMGVYDNNNLPFFMTFISDIASQISTNLIFGGQNSGTQLLNENANTIGVAAGLAAQAALSAQVSVSSGLKAQNKIGDQLVVSVKNLPKDGTVTFMVNGNNYENVQADQVKGYVITIDNNFIQGANALMAQVYDANENLVATINLGVVTIGTIKQAYNAGSNSPAVAGAFAAKPLSPIRGPIGISPRSGNQN